jgi:predicted nucleic acid-binding protein
MIAGMALAHNARIASRNVQHFADLSVELLNPSHNGLDPPGC